jgi:hypothetical protein
VTKRLPVLAAALLSVGVTAARADTITFSFTDDGNSPFPEYERTELPGTVTGSFAGIASNGITVPTSLQLTSAPAGLEVVPGTYSAILLEGTGLDLSDGVVVNANLLFNFYDANNNQFELRLNFSDGVGAPVITWLTWNGGTTPVVETGNGDGFYGITFNDLTPLPASVWLLLSGLIGLATLGRRRVGST